MVTLLSQLISLPTILSLFLISNSSLLYYAITALTVVADILSLHPPPRWYLVHVNLDQTSARRTSTGRLDDLWVSLLLRYPSVSRGLLFKSISYRYPLTFPVGLLLAVPFGSPSRLFGSSRSS